MPVVPVLTLPSGRLPDPVRVGAPGSNPKGDSALVQSAIDGLPTSGGELHLSAGVYKLTTPIVIGKRVTLTGAGSADKYFTTWGTMLESASTTGHALTVAAHGCLLADFAMRNTAGRYVTDAQLNGTNGIISQTAQFTAADVGKPVRGIGIPAGTTITSVTNATQIVMSASATISRNSVVVTIGRPTAGSGVRVTAGDMTIMRDVAVSGFWNDLQFDDGSGWLMDGVFLRDPCNVGLQVDHLDVPDEGDQSINGCTIYAGPTNASPRAAVLWQSGGGFKFVSNKVNRFYDWPQARFRKGLEFAARNGVDTSVFVVSGNSLENTDEQMLYFHRDTQGASSGWGYYHKIVVTGNEIALGQDGVCFNSPGDTPGGQLEGDIVIADDVIQGMNGYGIRVANSADVIIGTNHFSNVNTGIFIDLANERLAVHEQSWGDGVGTLFALNSEGITDYNAHTTSRARLALGFEREIPYDVGTTAYVPLFTWGTWDRSAGFFDFTLSGVAGNNPFTVSGRRSWTRNNGAVTIATVGTDSVVGVPVDFQVTGDANGGHAQISVRQASSAPGAVYWGRCRVDLRGFGVSRFWRGGAA